MGRRKAGAVPTLSIPVLPDCMAWLKCSKALAPAGWNRHSDKNWGTKYSWRRGFALGLGSAKKPFHQQWEGYRWCCSEEMLKSCYLHLFIWLTLKATYSATYTFLIIVSSLKIKPMTLVLLVLYSSEATGTACACTYFLVVDVKVNIKCHLSSILLL